jgi:hypothetical protein
MANITISKREMSFFIVSPPLLLEVTIGSLPTETTHVYGAF